jgi:hypothetical protein
MKCAAARLVVLASSAAAVHAGTFRVVDPDDRPVAGAAVMCSSSEPGAALTDRDGLATIPDACPRVSCMKGDYLPGVAQRDAGVAVCRLVAGVRLTVVPRPDRCAGDCHARLSPVEREPGTADPRLQRDPASGSFHSRVAPRAYEVVLHADAADWLCRTRIEVTATDALEVQATWRAPHALAGVVLDDRGRPIGDIPVRTRPLEPGITHCARTADATDLFTAEDGSFSIPVDPQGRTSIEAGSSWDPDGFASLDIAPPLPGSLVLHLRKDRP